jgi:signal transduction histidine kinase
MARVELEAQGERALAWGDAQRVTQIVANLVTNAIKHAPFGSAVRVMMHVIGVWGCVTVEDEGQGFLPEDVERMFMPFWRGPIDRTSPIARAAAWA